MNFEYKALNSAGEEVKGTIESPTRKEAVKAIRDKGLFPVKVKQIEDSSGEKKTPFDEEVDKIEKEMGATNDTESIPPPDTDEDENQETPEEPVLDINVLLKEVVKLYRHYEPLIQKVMNDGAVFAAQKVVEYKSKPAQMIEEQKATNRKLDVQNALLQNVNEYLIELLKTQMEINRKS